MILTSTPYGSDRWFWRWWSDTIVTVNNVQEAQTIMGVSLKPSDAVAGGGGIDDVDVTIKSCRFRLWDYNGTIANPVLGLEVTFVDDEGGEAAQVYSAGDVKHFIPSPDGSEAVAVGAAQNLNDSTNAMAFMVSLVNGGFPEDKIGDKVSVFEGTRVHVNQVPQPKRKGLVGSVEGKTILLVSKIHSYPWDAKGKATAPKGIAPKAAPKQAAQAAQAAAPQQAQAPVAQAAAPVANEALNARGMEVMLQIVLGKGGSITKGQIAQEAFKALASDPNRNALVQMVYSDDFLKQEGAPWVYDGSTVSMALT